MTVGSVETEVRRVEKPWGYEIVYGLTDRYCGELLFIREGEQLSLQFHREKDEVIYLHEGRIELEISAPGDSVRESEVVVAGGAYRIKPGMVHRWRALEDTVVLEVSTPHLEDVVRLDDDYGRA